MEDDYELALSLQRAYDSEQNSPSENEQLTYLRTDVPKPIEPTQRNTQDQSLDYALALSLVQEEGLEESEVTVQKRQETSRLKDEWDPKKIVDSSWELVDPNPDIHNLFIQFDMMFFDHVLSNRGVAVTWSKRMTLCAGVCCYEGRGGLCCIKLSEPLLKLRPRKDLVETLLHEMIHALLFVTANNKDREGHGPEFQKHMNRINAATGANITVKLYQQHWWKCDGPCQKRPPFYGMVRRATNRAPSANDRWWNDHAASCGGKFVKIKEPEGYSEKKKPTKEEKKAGSDSKVGMDSKAGVGSKSGAAKGSGNIVDLFNKARGSSQDNSDGSKVKSEEPRRTIVNGRIIVNSQASDNPTPFITTPIQQQPSSVKEYKDIRSNVLAAVERRINKGNKAPVKRSNTNSKEQTIPSRKKGRLTADDEDDVILVNIEKPTSSSTTTSKTVPSNRVVPSSRPGSLKDQSRSSTDTISISTTPTVAISISDSSSSTSVTHKSVQNTSCPVCLRDDIPYSVISTHVEFCLEEMELDENELLI